MKEIRVANTFWSRLLGIRPNETHLVLEPCNAIHTFGMKDTLLVIFEDRNRNILATYDVKPNRIVICPGAYRVIEVRRCHSG